MMDDLKQDILFDLAPYLTAHEDPKSPSTRGYDPVLGGEAMRKYNAELNERFYPGTTVDQWLSYFDGEGERPVPFGTPIQRPTVPTQAYQPRDGVLVAHDEAAHETIITSTFNGVTTITHHSLKDIETPPEAPRRAIKPVTAQTLSLWEPWALLAACGAKRFETRHKPTDYRGWLVIHAAKRWTRSEQAFAARPAFARHIRAAGYTPDRVPLGAALGVVWLNQIYRTEDISGSLSREELSFGNFTDGRFAWELTQARLFPKPIPLSGQQWLWKWDERIFSLTEFLQDVA